MVKNRALYAVFAYLGHCWFSIAFSSNLNNLDYILFAVVNLYTNYAFCHEYIFVKGEQCTAELGANTVL